MDKIKTEKLKFILTIFIGIIIGILIGATAITALVSYRLDIYYEEVQQLRITIKDKEEQFKKLEKSINKRRFILKDIKVVLDHDGDDIEEIELIKHIKEKYNKLIGKEVKTIDIDMVDEIIDKRIMKLNKKEYRLSVTKIILTDVLQLWIEAKLIE